MIDQSAHTTNAVGNVRADPLPAAPDFSALALNIVAVARDKPRLAPGHAALLLAPTVRKVDVRVLAVGAEGSAGGTALGKVGRAHGHHRGLHLERGFLQNWGIY